MSKKIFISCEKASHVCDKSQYEEASFWEKIKLNLHLIYCKACRKYSNKNSKLTKLMTNKTVAMDNSAKENLKTTFEKELEKYQQ